MSFGSVVQFEIHNPLDGKSNTEEADLDSVYEFCDLLEIANQDTQSVQMTCEHTGDVLIELALVNETGILDEELSVGEE